MLKVCPLIDLFFTEEIPGHNSRIPPQLEQNHVGLPSSQDEALACYSAQSILGVWAKTASTRTKQPNPPCQ